MGILLLQRTPHFGAIRLDENQWDSSPEIGAGTLSPLWFVPWMEQTYPLQPVVAFFLKIGTYKKHRPAMGAVLFCTYEIQTTTKSLKKGVRADRFQIPWRNCPIHRRTLSSGFHIAPAIDSNLSSRPERILKTQNASNGLETRSSYVFIYARWLAAGSGTGYFFVATPQAFSMLSSVFYYT